ncbi:hypothetical protein DWW31_00380 [Clostridium sp. AF15-17LB]|nr:hypothetical protein DWW31_00380 [Clostridium sp. AF15-17LB]
MNSYLCIGFSGSSGSSGSSGPSGPSGCSGSSPSSASLSFSVPALSPVTEMPPAFSAMSFARLFDSCAEPAADTAKIIIIIMVISFIFLPILLPLPPGCHILSATS